MKLKNFLIQYGLSAGPRLAKAAFRKVGVIFETFYLLKYTINENDIGKIFNTTDYSHAIEIFEKDISRINFVDNEKLKLFKTRFESGNYSCFAIVIDDEIQYITWI